ncbi:STAS domain-containing protein [Propionivibrio limicola]|uniref:STAS domain-containing protein n=1 Tax=Propionivibrio limicola TaxID=167645 RepID=UPI0012926D27|nr:STAS domain-containing protein [Propionivibrio limicola]
MIEPTENGVRITGPMLTANAHGLLTAGRVFLAGLPASALCVVDLSPVSEADSSSLSVVFAWLRTARQLGVDVRVAHPPASMLSLAALYGVSDTLPLV